MGYSFRDRKYVTVGEDGSIGWWKLSVPRDKELIEHDIIENLKLGTIMVYGGDVSLSVIAGVDYGIPMLIRIYVYKKQTLDLIGLMLSTKLFSKDTVVAAYHCYGKELSADGKRCKYVCVAYRHGTEYQVDIEVIAQDVLPVAVDVDGVSVECEESLVVRCLGNLEDARYRTALKSLIVRKSYSNSVLQMLAETLNIEMKLDNDYGFGEFVSGMKRDTEMQWNPEEGKWIEKN